MCLLGFIFLVFSILFMFLFFLSLSCYFDDCVMLLCWGEGVEGVCVCGGGEGVTMKTSPSQVWQKLKESSFQRPCPWCRVYQRVEKMHVKCEVHWEELGPYCCPAAATESITITPADARWVGAWWLGYLIAGVITLLAAIPFWFLPRSLPLSGPRRPDRCAPEQASFIKDSPLQKHKYPAENKSTFVEMAKGEEKSILCVSSSSSSWHCSLCDHTLVFIFYFSGASVSFWIPTKVFWLQKTFAHIGKCMIFEKNSKRIVKWFPKWSLGTNKDTNKS